MFNKIWFKFPERVSLKTLVLRTPCFGSSYPQVVRVPRLRTTDLNEVFFFCRHISICARVLSSNTVFLVYAMFARVVLRCVWGWQDIKPGVSKHLSEGHINYYITVRGPDILRYVTVSGKVTLYQSNIFCKYIIFPLLTTWLRGPDEIISRAEIRPASRIWPAGRSLETPPLNN